MYQFLHQPPIGSQHYSVGKASGCSSAASAAIASWKLGVGPAHDVFVLLW